MELKWLEDFLSIARSKSFSLAAKNRNITQPALSRRIRQLESWLGVDLIDRRTYPISLTAAGRTFRDTAQNIVDSAYRDRALFQDELANTQCDICIAGATTLLRNYIPNWLKDARSSFGTVTVKLETRNFNDMVQALLDGDIDLVAQYSHVEIPPLFDEEKFESTLLSEELLLPVSTIDENGDAQYALPGDPDAPLPYYGYSQDGYLNLVEQTIKERNAATVYLTRRDETPIAEVLKQLLLTGSGMAWLPESCAASELASGELVKIGDDNWVDTLQIRLYRYRQNKRSIVQHFWEHIAERTVDSP